ncbi:beta-1,6-N-acetylglucosaminyltransferase [Neobacillus sp.]|uniref:beta-1,6-N-acetylglucosaminyltransferase n=1 Tax=Neobacillus sp. TaxID=2675273 RepID=UPI0028A0EA3C|nr:beta-1,6-N-acetylglucosaminyltransferase [Neobacillus sp.]
MNSSLRTAYILQIHQNPDQVNKFIKQLISEKQADVFVHIDKRNYQNLKERIAKSPFVKVLQQCGICEWGDISQVDSTIRLLREVVASEKEYDFVCLRSGQDLLVKAGFKDFLINNKGKIFMTLGNVGRFNSGLMEISWPKFIRKRYASFHPARVFRSIVLGLYRKGINIFPNPNKLPEEYSLYKGSQWFTVPYEVAQYIIRFLDENEWFYKYFEHSLVPDQWFFHTLIMNSQYKTDVIDNNLLFLKWGETLSSQNSPQDLTSEDSQLIEESDDYFARKFDENIDGSVINYFADKVNFECPKLAKKDEKFYVRL